MSSRRPLLPFLWLVQDMFCSSVRGGEVYSLPKRGQISLLDFTQMQFKSSFLPSLQLIWFWAVAAAAASITDHWSVRQTRVRLTEQLRWQKQQPSLLRQTKITISALIYSSQELINDKGLVLKRNIWSRQTWKLFSFSSSDDQLSPSEPRKWHLSFCTETTLTVF